MRKLIGTFTILFTSFAFAAPPPPDPVEIAGARADRLLNIERVGGATNGTTFEFALPPGRLHAISASIASDYVGYTCNVRTFLELTDVNANTVAKSLGSSVATRGDFVAVTQDYSTPIEVRLSDGESAKLVFGLVGSAASCTVNLSAVYETMGD